MRRPSRVSRPGRSPTGRPLTALLAAGLLFLASCGEEGPDSPLAAPGSDLSAAAAAGSPDFGPAIAAANRHTPALMRIPGVQGTAVGLNDGGRPSVKIFLSRSGIPGLPERLDDIPVQMEVTGLFVLRQDRTARARPAPIGFSVGHPDITAGTLGARVTDGTNVFILSNNHILANNNDAIIGDAALQPGTFDGGSEPGDVIGTLYDFQPISFDSNNEMDAAIAIVDPSDVSGSTPTTAGYGAPDTSPVEAFVGQNVQKYGRTTGHTFGTVEAINVTVNVCFETRGPFQCAKSATFVNQFSIVDGEFSAGGDSGSLIVTESGNNPVGLLFAGSSTRTLANPIQVVLERFGVSIDPTVPDGDGGPTDPDPTGPTASFTASCSELTCNFDASSSSAGDSPIASYAWTFGDGTSGSGLTTSRTYASSGTYTVTLTVTDGEGLSDQQSQSVSVESAPGEGELGISQFQVSTRTQGPWRRADVTWTVSHTGGGLASVTTELLSGTSVLASQTSSVSGSSASGEHSVRTRSGTADKVRLTVTDVDGKTLVQEQPVSF